MSFYENFNKEEFQNFLVKISIKNSCVKVNVLLRRNSSFFSPKRVAQKQKF